MGNGKHHITAIATDNNSNINTLPSPLCPRDSAHPEPQQVSIVVACPCTDYINYSEAPETSHCQNLTCYAKHAALSMTPDILKIETFRHWGLGGFSQYSQMSVHRNLRASAKSGVREKKCLK